MPFIQFQIRHDFAANWTSVNPVLALGEMGIEVDTNKFKFGDGSTPWNGLPYVGGTDINVTTGTAVGAYQAVSLHGDGLAYPADAGTAGDAGAVVGVSTTSGGTGASVNIRVSGDVSNLGWTLAPGQQAFLGLGGAVVSSVPGGAAFQQPLGVAASSTRLLVEVGLPIVLT